MQRMLINNCFNKKKLLALCFIILNASAFNVNANTNASKKSNLKKIYVENSLLDNW